MTTTTHRLLVIGGAILLALALSAALLVAQAPTTGANYVPPNDSISGQTMVDELVRSHREEIRLSRATVHASRNPDVRRFADQMVTEHTVALNGILTLSDQLGYTRGDSLTTFAATTPVDAGLGAGLSSLANAEADQAYISSMIGTHEALLRMLQARAAKTTDPTVRAQAIETIATVEGHLAAARRLQAPPPPPPEQ